MAKTVLIRGVGPTLAMFGVPDPITRANINVYDANGNLRDVNLDLLSGPGSTGSFGSGNNFDATNPPNNGWNDIGMDTFTAQRDISLTFPMAGTYVFAAAAMDTAGNYVNYANYPNVSPTLTITVNPPSM